MPKVDITATQIRRSPSCLFDALESGHTIRLHRYGQVCGEASAFRPTPVGERLALTDEQLVMFGHCLVAYRHQHGADHPDIDDELIDAIQEAAMRRGAKKARPSASHLRLPPAPERIVADDEPVTDGGVEDMF